MSSVYSLKKFLEEKVKEVCPSVGFKIKWQGDEKGDYSVNVGSEEKAKRVKKELSDLEYLSKIEIEKGFVNFWLSEEALKEALSSLGSSASKLEEKEKIQVEFISANPTGPLTLGNGRGGVYGDVLANVLEACGARVEKEYYINDAGNQIEILGHSVLKDEEAEYKGEYIDNLAKQIKDKDPKTIGESAAEIILKSIKKTVSDMGISFDRWFSEKKELREKGKVEEIIKWFKEKNLAYQKDGALWFRASEFGDTKDRVLVRENGEPTYFCVDAAYHKNKFVERKFDKVINIWGADHHGDVARLKGFVEALGFGEKLEIILMQHVRLVKDGKPARMSKREGNFILIDDVLKEVGRDVFRYFMLMRSPNTHMDFDMDLAKEQSKKNPVYYVQYAGARMSSILEKANWSGKKIDFSSIGLAVGSLSENKIKAREEKSNFLGRPDRSLVLKLIQFPEVLEDIAKDYQVHKLATYVYELAKTFTDFYENIPVLQAENKELKQARLALVVASRQILENALQIMGIRAPKKM